MDSALALLENYTVLLILIAWLAPWKAFALWRAAKRGQWFTFALFFVLIPVNTFALVEILYIFSWSRERVQTDNVENKREQKEQKARVPEFVSVGRGVVGSNVAKYRGVRSEAPDLESLLDTKDHGKIDLAALAELEKIRSMGEGSEAKIQDRGTEKRATTVGRAPRKTVRPDVPIPKPQKDGYNQHQTAQNDKDSAKTPRGAESIMPGVFVPSKSGTVTANQKIANVSTGILKGVQASASKNRFRSTTGAGTNAPELTAQNIVSDMPQLSKKQFLSLGTEKV